MIQPHNDELTGILSKLDSYMPLRYRGELLFKAASLDDAVVSFDKLCENLRNTLFIEEEFKILYLAHLVSVGDKVSVKFFLTNPISLKTSHQLPQLIEDYYCFIYSIICDLGDPANFIDLLGYVPELSMSKAEILGYPSKDNAFGSKLIVSPELLEKER
jgi:hypothetical protein